MVGEWRRLIDDYTIEKGGTTRVIFVEAFSTLENTMRYYADSEGSPRAHFPFNFMLLEKLNVNSTAQDFKNIIDAWISNLPSGATSNWVVSDNEVMNSPQRRKSNFCYSLETMINRDLGHVTERKGLMVC